MVRVMIPSFNIARIPNIIFGIGKLNDLFNLIPKFGKNILIITGGKSLKSSGEWDKIAENLDKLLITYSQVSISGEPSPSMVDKYATKFRGKNIDLIVGIGGGSVIDAGKAISAMIPKRYSIKEYLEGVGTKTYDGEKISYIAIPTASGTGSEATKNAVISKIGPEGFKKSLRHDNLVPDFAIIDPELMISCPQSVTAACGMDAFTQLLEAYVSPKGNPMTDALALSGIKYMKDNIIPACSNGASDVKVRAAMAYGSLMSGITLANAGLGVIHGFASPIGGFFNIPHGVICGTLLAEATKMNIEMLKKKGPSGKLGLKKHADIGALFYDGEPVKKDNILKYCDILIITLQKWTDQLNIDRLGKYGINISDVDKIVAKTGLKNNPVELSKEDIKSILINRI